MNTCRAFLVCCALLGASCATHPVRPVDVPPATDQWRPAPATRPVTETPAAEVPQGMTDEATDRWLSEQIGTRIEEERQQEQARTNAEAYRRAAEQQSSEVHNGPYCVDRRHSYGFFPWNTLFYGGLGAVIGHQSGHRDQGLAIGAGVGLVLDTMRSNCW